MSDFQREREALGQWLSQLRRDAGLNGKEIAGLLGWHTLETHYVSHRRILAQGHTSLQRAWAAHEETTTYLRVFEIALVPGLLQTADYAQHVFSAMAALKNLPDDTSTAVAARIERQHVLYDPRKRFLFL